MLVAKGLLCPCLGVEMAERRLLIMPRCPARVRQRWLIGRPVRLVRPSREFYCTMLPRVSAGPRWA